MAAAPCRSWFGCASRPGPVAAIGGRRCGPTGGGRERHPPTPVPTVLAQATEARASRWKPAPPLGGLSSHGRVAHTPRAGGRHGQSAYRRWRRAFCGDSTFTEPAGLLVGGMSPFAARSPPPVATGLAPVAPTTTSSAGTSVDFHVEAPRVVSTSSSALALWAVVGAGHLTHSPTLVLALGGDDRAGLLLRSWLAGSHLPRRWAWCRHRLGRQLRWGQWPAHPPRDRPAPAAADGADRGAVAGTPRGPTMTVGVDGLPGSPCRPGPHSGGYRQRVWGMNCTRADGRGVGDGRSGLSSPTLTMAMPTDGAGATSLPSRPTREVSPTDLGRRGGVLRGPLCLSDRYDNASPMAAPTATPKALRWVDRAIRTAMSSGCLGTLSGRCGHRPCSTLAVHHGARGPFTGAQGPHSGVCCGRSLSLWRAIIYGRGSSPVRPV